MTAIEATTTTTAAAAAKTLNSLLQLPAQMELSQIELIYRAEGNANLVLALPQFKKVLRLPKMISNRQQSHNVDSQDSCQSRPEKQPNVSDPTKAGVLTMPDFMAYIEIMRRLLGNEFVCEPDIVAIPKQSDRFWINEHIRAHRPVARLDKEFVGPFGLMLPDVTQLPATFDVLLANLQAKDMNTDMNADICNESNEFSTRVASSSSSKRNADDGGAGGGGGTEGISRLGDTYAIEIKPKQGWLQLASDVSDLFDLMPAGAKTMDTTSDVATSCNRTNLLATGGERLTELTPDKCRCRYCSMQHLKLQTGKIKRLGEYCPMELFSGTPGRMVNALNALFACPQNNLRVFQRGNLIYGDHANSISCDELHTRVFPGEIMALIKYLLVACLLREYGNNTNEMDQQQQQQQQPEEGGAAVRCGMKTKATETTTESGAANVDAAVATAWHEHETETRGQQQLAGIVEFVKAVATGQPQQEQQQQQQRRCSTRAAAEKATQRYTKRSRTATATTSTAATCCESTTRLSTNVAMAATRTETETLPTATSPPTTTTMMMMATPTPNPNKTRAQINKAEIFHLPKNCVLQKILHLQLLVKRHFHYMWQTGQAQHATPSYAALRALLSRCQQEPALALALDNVDQLAAEEAYMLGATALDCSIMLTFQEIRCHPRHNSLLQPWLVTVQGRQFLTKLSVLDLDPKPDSHFHKFVKQMREIEKCCRALN